MTSRDAILGRIRGGLGAQADDPERRAAVDARLRRAARENRQESPVPAIAQASGRAGVEQFIDRARAALATVRIVSRFEEVPAATAEALRARNSPPSLTMGRDEALSGLDWRGLDVRVGPGRIDEPATLSRAAAGLAEIGALVFVSSAANPSSLAFLGAQHLAVLRARDVVGGYEGLWARLRADRIDARSTTLVAGPSRTGDIEGKLELGAHGPIALDILLVDDL